ncbi:MAG: BrnT family toxin [bacterium]|nr:BrnT family toxin [bacterium]
MRYFDWNEEKNILLKAERGVCFEDVILAVEEGKLLESSDHGNKKKYPNQKILIVEIEGYAYTVPYVEDEEKVFLKTIIPNRKATKRYLIDNNKK